MRFVSELISAYFSFILFILISDLMLAVLSFDIVISSQRVCCLRKAQTASIERCNLHRKRHIRRWC